MSRPWSDRVAAQLLNTSICPRCESTDLSGGVCSTCGADLQTPAAVEVWQASVAAASAIQRRQTAIDRLPTSARVPALVGGGAPPPADIPPPPPTAQATVPTSAGGGSQVSLQSVLAGAGAGLFAVAAIVFTFFNPDLTDFGTRTVIVAVVTALFLTGAWLLAHRGLQFSAESVGALGVVFVGLDVWSFSETAPPSVSGYAVGAAGTVVASIGLLLLARGARVRVWLWSAVLGFVITPALLGYAAANSWVSSVGHLGVALAGVGALALLHRLGRPFARQLGAERVTVTVLQILALASVTIGVLFLTGPSPIWAGLGRCALLGSLAIAALLSTRYAAARFWSFNCGALVVAAAAALVFALDLADPVWYVALAPLAAALALAALRLVPPSPAVRPAELRWGATTLAMMAAAPAVLSAVLQLLGPGIELMLGWRDRGTASAYSDVVGGDLGLAAILGLSFFAAGLWLLFRGVHGAARLDAVDAPPRPSAGSLVALWTAALAVVTFAGWAALPHVARVSASLALAVGICLVLLRVPRARALPSSERVPLILAAHVLVLLAACLSWIDRSLTVPTGAALVAVLVAVGLTMSPRFRFLYVGIGYAYALGIFATGLSDAGIETIPLLCLTTTAASLVTLAATLTDWVPVRSWYAMLVVTAVPFLFGVGSVLTVRSGWTALSTAVTFALALALVITPRQGLTWMLRAAAAALLVPSLAVVIVSLGAEVLAVSASPVTLPLIALVVACVLPSRNLIADGLRRRGLAEADIRGSVLSIEISSLLTAALAVLLALVRDAAGLGTTFLVLLILGLGAAATGYFAHRRYGWWTAGVSWTGALWCVWAIAGVDVVEPYLLPPALAAMTVGFVLTARRATAIGLYATALSCAVLPSLAILALVGSGSATGLAGQIPWRAFGLLVGAGALLVLGWALSRRPEPSRLHGLAVPTLLGSVTAAAAGAVQAVRYGSGRDTLDLASDEVVMLPVIALSIAATAIAGVAAGVLLASPGRRALAGASPAGRWFTRPRWLYVPASVFLVIGPIAGIRPGWFPIWTLWTLSAALLALMLVTVARAGRRPTTLPPVWFTFLLAWATAVAGWSERELRVEAFSLPLGLALLGAGILAARAAPSSEAQGRQPTSLNSWPIGFTGSWRLFAPGILVTILPSVLATGTDPLTQRAILVIALALAAILIGLLRRQAAPFLLGLVVLPVENAIVFMVQIGRSISAAPWWITLATAGAVLLVIAVGYERRSAQRGVAARLRDLS
jgi:hypothetical protein